MSGNAGAARTVRIVLPAFNEAENLPTLLAALRDTMSDHHLAYEIILVDDASTDDTAAVARRRTDQLPLQLIGHAVTSVWEGRCATASP